MMQITSQFGDVEQEPEEKSDGYKIQEKRNESKSKKGSKEASHAVSSTVSLLVN
jgi:hypothetical protein